MAEPGEWAFQSAEYLNWIMAPGIGIAHIITNSSSC